MALFPMVTGGGTGIETGLYYQIQSNASYPFLLTSGKSNTVAIGSTPVAMLWGIKGFKRIKTTVTSGIKVSSDGINFTSVSFPANTFIDVTNYIVLIIEATSNITLTAE